MAVTFLLAVASLFVLRRLLARLALVGLAVSLLLILSAAYDWYRYEWTAHGAIVQKQTIVRKGMLKVTSRRSPPHSTKARSSRW